MIKRTRLSRSKDTESVSESYESPLAAPQTEIPDSESGRDKVASVTRSLGRGTKTIIGVIAFTLFVVVAVHTALAGSLMFTASLDDKPATERVWVARGTFIGGNIDSGTTVYGSTTTYAPDNFLTKVMEGYTGAPDYFVAEVIAGPIASVSNGSGEKILINGKDSGYVGKVEKIDLKNQYLAQCIDGACEKGKMIVAEYASISGEVRGILYPFGMKEFPTAKDSGDNESK